MGTEAGVAPPKVYVRLVDVDPDFARLIPGSEKESAGGVKLPAIDLPQGEFDPVEVIGRVGGYYGVLVEGMLHCTARVGDHVSLRVLGPSAVVPTFERTPQPFFATSQWTMASPGRIAVLGDDFLRAARTWPPLYLDLLYRMEEQTDQLITQLTLCQLPRVEDRLLAMLWLLAESWGKVTAAGTLLPLHFTHQALGAMVGARRSTVTLALGKLSERGSAVDRDGGWLLLEPPLQSREQPSQLELSRPIDLTPTSWSEAADGRPGAQRDEHKELSDLIGRLRVEHQRSVEELRQPQAGKDDR